MRSTPRSTVRTRATRASDGFHVPVLVVAAFCLIAWFFSRDPRTAEAGPGAHTTLATTSVSRELVRAPLLEGAPPADVATLVHARGDVKVRDGESLGWGDAREPVALHAGDAVQTFARAGALLILGPGDALSLGERTLFVADVPHVLGPATAAPRGSLLEGALSATLVGSRSSPRAPFFELILPGARLTFAPAGTDARVQFRASRNPDATSSISLVSGRGLLVGRNGSEKLTQGFGWTLDESGAVLERRTLPAAPGVLTPMGGTELVYRDVPPRVAFRWNPIAHASAYRLRVARDRDFEDLLFDQIVDGRDFTLSDLHAGEHYWSVSAVDGWHEGLPSVPRRLRIVRDAEPPELSVDSSDAADDSGHLVLHGRTEPGAQVFVQGRPIAVASDGAFQTALDLSPGAALVAIEAADGVGNITYRSQVVTTRGMEPYSVADAQPPQ
jgi:hypothetical protein